MSVHSQGRRRRCSRVLLAILVVALAAFSTGSARAVSDHPLVHGTIGATAASAQGSAGPAAEQVLGGFTSQGWPVVIVISKDGKRIGLVETGLNMSCTSGDSFPLLDGWVRLPIAANGSVRGHTTIQPASGSAVSITGGSDSFTGKLNRKRDTFAGTWQLQMSLAQTNGQTDQCDSGLVRFTAKL